MITLRGWGGVFGGTPDTEDWIGKGDHYRLFIDLIAAIDSYLVSNPSLTKVYVSGHSLGAAMAQQYMLTHSGLRYEPTPGARYEAVLFASPGYGVDRGEDLLRISNIWLDGDLINIVAWGSHNSGDDNTILRVLRQPNLMA